MSSTDTIEEIIYTVIAFAVIMLITYFVLYKKQPKFVMLKGAFSKEKALFYSGVAAAIVIILFFIVMRMFRKPAPMPLNMRRSYYMA